PLFPYTTLFRSVLHQVSGVPESALPSEVEGSLALGAARGLAASSLGEQMAREPRDGRRPARSLRRLSEAEQRRQEPPERRRAGSPVQAVSGLGGRKDRQRPRPGSGTALSG